MGYEIKLIVGNIISTGDFIEIASVDLSKIGDGPLNKLIEFAKGKSKSLDFEKWGNFKNNMGKHLGLEGDVADLFNVGTNYRNVSIYDANEKMDEDLYGDPLPAIPVFQVHSVILEELRLDSTYRRFHLAECILREFTTSRWDNIFVVPFGH